MRYGKLFDHRALQHRGVGTALDGVVPPLKFAGPIKPRDEAVFWLTVAAEIEHALMVQYLFAGYSLDPAGAGSQEQAVEDLRHSLLQIAREEMGHLITVQNLLIVLGGAINLGRDQSPLEGSVHPFRFKLEPLTLGSLAKYVIAESPNLPRDDFDSLPLSDERKKLLRDTILPDAARNNDGQEVLHVGSIFARLIWLVKHDLDDADFRLDRQAYQARWSDWGYAAQSSSAESGAHGGRVLVREIKATTPADVRAAVAEALRAIGNQGEFVDDDMDSLDESHFERFLQAYEKLRDISSVLGRVPTWPVVRFPNVSVADRDIAAMPMVEVVFQRHMEEGRITHPRTRDWAHLFNLRYRLLLAALAHGMNLPGPSYEQSGERTPKGLLQAWAFAEMVHVSKLALKLVGMPLDEIGSKRNAGPPFELPYTLTHSMFEVDRWLCLADLFGASRDWVVEMQARHAADTTDPFLVHLAQADAEGEVVARAVAASDSVPAEPDAADRPFHKVVRWLEEAVRGFDITVWPSGRRHGNFWAGKTRDQFVDKIVVPGDPDASVLLSRLRLPPEGNASMPRDRPSLPESRLAAIRDWIAAGAPDSKPAGEIGLHREPAPNVEQRPDPATPVAAPAPAQVPTPAIPGFEEDVRPLFTAFDRESMTPWFDLHKYDDVKQHAARILARLKDGTMPCTGRWPEGDLDTFVAWRDGGFKRSRSDL